MPLVMIAVAMKQVDDNASLSPNNRLYVDIGQLPTYSPANISSAATTTVKTGKGILHSLTILGGTLGAITIYDNTAGNGTVLVQTFTPTTTGTYTFDLQFSTGLTIVTAAATLLQVSYA